MEMGLFETAASYKSVMGLSVEDSKTVVTITNSNGSRFPIFIPDLESAFEDLLEKNDVFVKAGEKFHQNRWREASIVAFRSEAIKTFARTQTKPFFSLLSKLVAAANKVSLSEFNEERIDLSTTAVSAALKALVSYSSDNSAGRSSVSTVRAETSAVKGENILLYGAPGTGKSRAATDEAVIRTAEKKEYIFRTVFHGDTMQGDFVGSIRPKLNGASVTYGFAPGPFARALKTAIANPSEHVVLIIEELNRANAAAAFGEVFQLLDRDESGASCYEVHPESEELTAYIYGTVGGGQSGGQDTICIPANLSLIATMNSADQGVKSIDMAFRRRWKAIYQRLDVTRAPDARVWVDPSLELSWPEFLQVLNDYLVSVLATEEDRLIGQYFASESDLADGRVPDKLLLYLWDDLLRGEDRSLLFSKNLKTYAQLQFEVHDRKSYFSEGFLLAASQRARQG